MMTGHSKSNSNDDDEVESVQVPTEKTNTKWKKPTHRRPMNFTKHIFSMIFFDDSAKIEEIVAVMKGLLNSLFDAYSGWNSSPPLSSESFPSGSASCGGGGSSSSPHLVDNTDRQQGYIMEYGDDILRVAHPFLGYAKKVLIQNYGKLVTTEGERYLLDPIKDPSNDKLNVLLWWKVNGSKYLILQKIARDILAIPVSTVALESAFSTGGRITDKYRSSLTPIMIEALICTENW